MGTYGSLLGQSVLLGIVFAIVAALSPAEARPWVILCAIIALGFFIAISLYRHRRITRLTEEIDEVLHRGRSLDFSDCIEGDIAALSSELGKVVAQLSLTTELLESEKGLLSDALADISHQIRTPLTAAMLMVSTVESAPDQESRIKALRELEGMLERIGWLVTTLLKIAKIDAGALHVEAREVNAAEGIRMALEPLATILDLRDVAVVLDLDESAAFTGDRLWFSEALENIIKNSMEHTPPGGSIKVLCKEDALGTTVVVADTGTGIADEDLPYLFDRFYRGRGEGAQGLEDSARNPAGFGIGLSLAHSLISAQGGTLRAANGADCGAVFTVSFPKSIL